MNCRGCGTEEPEVFLDLGSQPLANGYLKPEAAGEPEPHFPLAVAYCGDCHLVQLTHTVDPAALFTKYLYFSSFSAAFVAHAKELADDLVGRLSLNGDSQVVEVASNDGYLLQHFQAQGIPVLGVEPAANVAEVAEASGIPTRVAFFGPDVAAEIAAEGGCDLLLGLNVLAHVPALNDFLGATATALKPKGVVAFEFPWLRDFLAHCEFDTIYHEHVYYLSLTALSPRLDAAGLEVFEALPQPTHGGSLRLLAAPIGSRPVGESVATVMAAERADGLGSPKPYREFAGRVEALKQCLVERVRSYKAAGRRLVTYGASAKGNTLLNYFDLGTEVFDYAVDRSTYKQGYLTPGKHLPIRDPRCLVEDRPDYAVMLTWNFAEEILVQQAAYLEAGGTFVIPIPKLREVSA